MSGAVGYHAGLSAEDSVARHYGRAGLSERARRWRGPGGEIDLVLEGAGRLVFVEVKKSKTFAAAAARITARQMERIYASAAAYLGTMPAGQDTDARFDVALVDSTGAVEVIENAFGH